MIKETPAKIGEGQTVSLGDANTEASPAPEAPTSPQGSLAAFGAKDDEQSADEELDPSLLVGDADDKVSTDLEFGEGEVVDTMVLIYSKRCLGCGYLVDFAETKFNSCYYLNGNEDCPAAQVQILVRIPIEEIVQQFRTLEERGDSIKLSEAYQKLAKKPKWAQRRILEAIRADRNK